MNLDDVLLSWNINLLKLGNQIWQILSLLQKNKKGIIYPKQKKETRSPSSNSSFTQRPKPTLRLLWLQPSWDAMCWPGFIMIMITMTRKMMTLVIYSIQSGTNPADQVWGLLLGMAMWMRISSHPTRTCTVILPRIGSRLAHGHPRLRLPTLHRVIAIFNHLVLLLRFEWDEKMCEDDVDKATVNILVFSPSHSLVSLWLPLLERHSTDGREERKGNIVMDSARKFRLAKAIKSRKKHKNVHEIPVLCYWTNILVETWCCNSW